MVMSQGWGIEESPSPTKSYRSRAAQVSNRLHQSKIKNARNYEIGDQRDMRSYGPRGGALTQRKAKKKTKPLDSAGKSTWIRTGNVGSEGFSSDDGNWQAA